MIKVKRQKVRKKEVEKVFSSIRKNDLLEDRSEYDEQDLKSAYPQLSDKGAKLLHLMLQKWKYSKVKGKRKIASN